MAVRPDHRHHDRRLAGWTDIDLRGRQDDVGGGAAFYQASRTEGGHERRVGVAVDVSCADQSGGRVLLPVAARHGVGCHRAAFVDRLCASLAAVVESNPDRGRVDRGPGRRVDGAQRHTSVFRTAAARSAWQSTDR